MSALGKLPSFEGMETLFSWAAKTHLINGRSARWTAIQLFGTVRSARMHSSLAGIDHLTKVTDGVLGSPEELISTRTSLTGYLPFMSKEARSAVIQAFVQGECAEGDLRLGHRASKLSSAQSLRYCSACAAADSKEFGYSRWHIVHQLPAVWTCPDHQEKLVELCGTSKAWQLPGDNYERGESTRLGFGARQLLTRIAAISIAAHRLGAIQTDHLRESAIGRFCETGVVSNPRRLSALQISAAFRKSRVGTWVGAYEPLRLLFTRDDWIVSLLRDRTADHPVKWAVAWAFLWEEATGAQSLQAFNLAATGRLNQRQGTQLELWPESGTADLMYYLAKVESVLKQSTSLESASTTLAVSQKVLNGYMSKNASLRKCWLLRQHDLRLSNAIAKIQSFMQDNPGVERKSVLKACVADFTWLRRNEPAIAVKILSPLLRERLSTSKLLSGCSQPLPS